MLDHGVLNVPLSKRGNSDNQIDRYKREQEKAKREKHKTWAAEHKAMKAKALALIAELSEERAAELMAKYKFTRKQLDTELKQIAKSKPAVILRGI